MLSIMRGVNVAKTMGQGKGTVLVTGVAGFIGSNVAMALLEKGYRVTGLDNLSQGDIAKVEALKEMKQFRFIKGDIFSESDLAKAARGADRIVHLAAYKIPRYGNATDTLLVNGLGTKNVLDVAVKNKAKVVFTSTSDVYGKCADIPFEEEGDIVLGHSKVKRWSYAASKLFGEHLCFAYEEKYGLKTCVIRIFGTYGPGQNLTWWGGPHTTFIAAALKNKPLEIHGDGLQTRCFCYIDDTVDGIVRAVEKSASNGELINIGSNEEIKIIDLASLIWELVGAKGKVKLKFVPYSRFSSNYQDVRRRVPSMVKAKKILGYIPHVSMVEGLKRMIKWQRTLS
jgi:UDP-glucose 4-epimerase